MTDLLSKLKKITKETASYASLLSENSLLGKGDTIPTNVPIFNLALSGNLDGGFSAGSTIFAAPSKHFKTAFALLCVSAFLKKYPEDGYVMFFDSEFGAPLSYFDAFEIPKEKVMHIPIVNIETLKFQLVQTLNEVDRKDHLLLVIDSIGNLASTKELVDAQEGKVATDMTRAKELKGLFRMITPWLNLKDIPLVAVNHVYKDIMGGPYAGDVMSGGTGPLLGANTILYVGRQQEKEEKDLKGFNFILKVEKSRFVVEQSKFVVPVRFDGGIDQYGGLFELAIDNGFIIQEKRGWYKIPTKEEYPSFRRKTGTTKEFWEAMFKETNFKSLINEKYTIGVKSIFTEELVTGEEEIDENE